MSDIMRPIPFGRLMNWVLSEYEAYGTVFGVNKLYFHENGKTLPIFSEKIETPFGPAAGPHTQLAQNLIAAYAGGSRFFEMKTVQIIDGEDLPVSKPCISAEDEGYNTEWSTELYINEAFEEYLKAWFAIKLISKQFGFGEPDGFVFNMSVGYDLNGIKSKKVDSFIENMKNASETGVWTECVNWAKENINRFDKLNEEYIDSISPEICRSITLSTLHGCKPEEIERIASYLMVEKRLNTYIKCNPTLLGYDFVRKTMDDMGYGYLDFDDYHFKFDLKFDEAIPMLKRLLEVAKKETLEFGVKLTNTFPVRSSGVLTGDEMYMSGKSLYPLAINLAAKLEKEFGGRLRLSYSGGADRFNIGEIYKCGIWPITVCTVLLKPGGYDNLLPMAKTLSEMDYEPFEKADIMALQSLSEFAVTDSRYKKKQKRAEKAKESTNSPIGYNCSVVCGSCAAVCPNRANIVVNADEKLIVHIDKMCNECGNCASFCPFGYTPYIDKFTLFLNEADMKDSDNDGFTVIDEKAGRVKIRFGVNELEAELDNDTEIPPDIKAMIEALILKHAYCI